MAARTLSQVISELSGTYNPQIKSIQQQQAAIPGQIATEEQGLQAKQTQAFDDILGGARQRGLGFSGIPLSEQAKYTSTEFLPALARLRQSGNERKTSLQDAINQIYERRNTLGQQIYQGGLDRAEQKRQFDLNYKLAQQSAADARRSAASAFSPSMGYGGTPTPSGGISASAIQRKDKGFNFTNAKGQPVSAAVYAAAKGIAFRDLLTQMAKAGDKGAKQALGFVGNDLGYDPNKVNNPSLASLYNNLVWGTGRQATPYNAPQKRAPFQMNSNVSNAMRFNF